MTLRLWQSQYMYKDSFWFQSYELHLPVYFLEKRVKLVDAGVDARGYSGQVVLNEDLPFTKFNLCKPCQHPS